MLSRRAEASYADAADLSPDHRASPSGPPQAARGDDAAARHPDTGLAGRVVVLASSEFGRRPAENGSLGTDHGTAGPVLLAGPSIRPGVHGRTPRLDDLEGGDLAWAIDFRRVYASLLGGWLGPPADEVLGGSSGALPLLGA